MGPLIVGPEISGPTLRGAYARVLAEVSPLIVVDISLVL